MLNNIKVKAELLKSFLNEKGYKVKNTECIEAVSQMEVGQCYNIAKNKAIRILKPGEQLTFKEMKKNNFKIDVVISIPMNIVMEGIDTINDKASEMITGSDYALCDISYETYSYFYDVNSVAIRVKGYIEDLETLQYLDDYEEDE
jgi:hypothetical protein